MQGFGRLAAATLALMGLGAAPKVCGDCVKANMERLASPAMRGRACGTADENAAARFVADRLKAYGVAPAAPESGYLQTVKFAVGVYAEPPQLVVGARTFAWGRDFYSPNAPDSLEAQVVVAATGDAPAAYEGKLVVAEDAPMVRQVMAGRPAAVVTPPQPGMAPFWDQMAARPPGPTQVEGLPPPRPPSPGPRTLYAKPETLAALKAMAGQTARMSAPRRADPRVSYNVLGVVRGTAPDADRNAILFSAHYDHLGLVAGRLFPGANDDASGTAAVLELARVFGAGARPKRTVLFALFGCEEAGGHGAKLFLEKPPLPLGHIAANLEFEMIGARDPAHPDTLMLTGWERSNLGPTLAAQGARIGPDPYPQQNFFMRSDNYQLARRGVVAQTVSAWATTPTYHTPQDDLAHIDMAFMTEVIQSLTGPAVWLANGDFRPAWAPGGAP